jgi:hypothetical protein
MCKKTIETAAKNAGASKASWDTENKELTVSYKSKRYLLASNRQLQRLDTIPVILLLP